MTRAFQPLIPAQPTFTDTGLACSDRYDDVYHAASGAVEQAQYVFLQGNGLPERWQGLDQFTIVETGFGLGNNFLTTWHAWRSDPQRSQRLHFVSFEAHPFSAVHLIRMLQDTTPALRDLADQLIAQWPVLVPGIHRLEFEQAAVTLTLFFGDISQATKRMDCKANAFYLDGFAPRVNPAMWTKEVFGQLVRMAAPNATAATWCSAAHVRKALQDSGFVVERHPGFAFKRHMIRAQLRPHLGHSYPARPKDPVLIVGGGIAGAATAYALAQRGVASVVFDPVFSKGLGGAHQGHAAVALTPLITSDDAPRARLSRAGLWRAWQRWQPFVGSSLHICGTLVANLTADEAKNAESAVEDLGFDTDWVQYRDKRVASQLAQTDLAQGGLYFPKGAYAIPETLLEQLLSHPLITTVSQTVKAVQDLTGRWRLVTDQQESYEAEQVVIANAGAAPSLLKNHLSTQQASRLFDIDLLGGQSAVVGHEALQDSVRGIVAGNGYVIALDDHHYAVGSTYTEPNKGVCSAAHDEIMAKVAELTPVTQPVAPALSSWFGQRAALKDHLPLVCQAKPGLWVNVGYGSYGFSWAALAADRISTELCAEPTVLERDLLQSIALR